MTRPSPAYIDAIIADVAAPAERGVTTGKETVLAAEVRALREEMAKLRDLISQDDLDNARAALARAEALADEYEAIIADADRFRLDISPLSYEVAIDQIRTALRGS